MAATVGLLPQPSYGQQRLLQLGNRRLSINCTGARQKPVTIVLMPGGGEPSKNWAQVQAGVEKFVRVCSYDPAGSGESDKTDKPQSIDEIVEDLHSLLEKSGERSPFVLVAHSLAGLHARRFATRFPQQVAGFVFVDSTHEEQAWRLHEIDPKGPALGEGFARVGFFTTPGERLTWRTDLPLAVLAHGKPFPRTAQLTEEQFAKWDQIWGEMQRDLATRSPKGKFIRAENSGHFINLDEPVLVVQTVREVLEQSAPTLHHPR